ncbi:hypothetical protein [Lentilitoribacter sp. EG35]|uniref:hypothetical protein n=1 Tax=Lentilitoribacter sp. EG35 TaxID=3234192 RepID=UPI0034607B14
MLFKIIRIAAPAILLVAGLLGLYVIALMIDVELVSFAFLFGFPILCGLIIMHFRPKGSFKSFGKALLWLIGIMAISVAMSVTTSLEGMICIAMAVVPILLGTLLGGVIYLMVIRWKQEANGSLKIVTLPIIAFALLGLPENQPMPPEIYEISNMIEVNAPPEVVFNMLKSIPDISPQEIPTRMSHLLGVPKPTEAIWEESPNGTIRHSHWGEDVHFIERITAIEKNRRIAWDFEFPEGWIAEGLEDPHVKVGGKYFNILSGEYLLEDMDGKTRLSLTTRTYDNSQLGAYSKFWHEFFFKDFHNVILILVKNRTEAKISG